MVHASTDETMGRRLRFFQPDHCYFVTARCLQARMLLRPSVITNALVEGILARAARLHSVELFAFVFASNHVHLLVRASKGNLAGFMQFLLGNVARKVGPMNNWTGKLWERRYAAAPVLDDAALVDRLRYILAHGVKEGLVARCTEWPGVSCLRHLLGESSRAVEWFNWSRRARASGRDPVDRRFAEPECLEIKPLPGWGHLERRDRIRRVLEILQGIEHQAAKEHPNPLGAEHVLALPPDTRPERPKRGPAPLCHTSEPSLRTAFRELYVSFVHDFRNKIAGLRQSHAAASIPRYEVRLFFWPRAVLAA